MRKYIFYILAFVCVTTTWSQDELELANKYYRDYAYYKAADLYKKVLKNQDSTLKLIRRIGDCYYKNADPKNAIIWYEKALKKKKNYDKQHVYRYMQCLRSEKRYKEAYEWLLIYKNLKVKRSERDAFMSEVFQDLNTPKNSSNKTVSLGINTSFNEFGNHIHNNVIYYASSHLDSVELKKAKIYEWNNEPFLSIYKAKVTYTTDSIITGKPEKINDKNINTYIHEANPTLTKDGKTMYFTRDNVNKRYKLAYDKKGTSNLKIYKVIKKGNGWSNAIELPFNLDDYSTGHPALSADEKTLYFVSDRPGGIGKTDLYKVSILKNGKYGKIKNLGPEINTKEREQFPFIDKNNTLYFSSDGYINIGLLDIYKTNFLTKEKNEETEVLNLGFPYNSTLDDISYFVDTETNRGYYSSNKPNGKGGDDLYGFINTLCRQEIYGIIKNTDTKKPIADALVRLIDKDGQVLDSFSTNNKGEYLFNEVDCNNTYIISADHINYKSNKKEIETNKKHLNRYKLDIELKPLIINNEIVINPIYFDYNKSDIRLDAKYELENIVDVMVSHPNMIIKIEAHTDSRGRDNYNKLLSDRRAKSTRDYILSRGIAHDRIESAVGYGESQLINRCKNYVKCSEEEHQENRRSKFIITKE